MHQNSGHFRSLRMSSYLRSSTTLFCFDGRTDEAFNSREKDRAVRGVSNASHSTRKKDRAVRCVSNTSHSTILKKILKSSLPKTMEKECRLKHQIQNSVPDRIDHTNVAFQSDLETFVGVDPIRCTLLTLSFLHFLSHVLLRRDS
jgi:hypothetical protein